MATEQESKAQGSAKTSRELTNYLQQRLGAAAEASTQIT